MYRMYPADLCTKIFNGIYATCTIVLKEADEKAEAEAGLNETSDHLDSDHFPEWFKLINELDHNICSSCKDDDNAAKFASASAFSSASFKTMGGPFFMLC